MLSTKAVNHKTGDWLGYETCFNFIVGTENKISSKKISKNCEIVTVNF